MLLVSVHLISSSSFFHLLLLPGIRWTCAAAKPVRLPPVMLGCPRKGLGGAEIPGIGRRESEHCYHENDSAFRWATTCIRVVSYDHAGVLQPFVTEQQFS